MTSPGQSYAAILRSRRRRNRGLVWTRAEETLRDRYEKDLELIGRMHPELSPMERRVCVLAKAMIPNWKVGELLGISEKTVENHLRNARRRLNLPPGTRMYDYLASLGTALPAKPQASTPHKFLHAIL